MHELWMDAYFRRYPNWVGQRSKLVPAEHLQGQMKEAELLWALRT